MPLRHPAFEVREADWLSVGEAVARVLDAARPLPTENLPLDDVAGRVLGEPLVARATLPPWDNSAMDGYAVRGEDVGGATRTNPVRLEMRGDVRAGETPDGAVGRGQAIRIMTGAPMPPGADAVVPVEETDGEAEQAGVVAIRVGAEPGRNVRPGGQDVKAGEKVLSSGTTITPGVLAVLAALGHATIPVVRRPRIAILSSGDELRSIEDFSDVIDGKGVPEVNGPALLAAVRACGARGVGLGIARDDEQHIRQRIEASFGSDLLVTSGGASMGEADLFKRVLDTMGFTLDFWRVKIRPGSPISFGWIRRDDVDLPVLGLPGNPSSAFVTFQIFARPMILRMAGHRRVHRRVIAATAAEPLKSTPRLTHFHRVTLGGGPGARTVRLAGHPGSGLIRSIGAADALAVVPEGIALIQEGERVGVILLDDGPGASESLDYETGLE